MARVCAAVLSVLAVACVDRTPRPPKVDDPQAQLKLAKLTPYIACLDGHTGPVFQVGDLVRAGGTKVHATLDPKSCLAGIELAAKMPVLPELDAAGAAFASALGKIHTLTTEAESTGHLPPGLPAALDQFDSTQAELFDRTRQLNREIHRDSLAHRERQEGRTLAVQVAQVVFAAEEIVELAAVPADRLDSVNIGVLAERVLALETLAQQMSSRALAKHEEVKTFEGFFNFQHYLRKLIVQCKALIQRARDRVAYTDDEKLRIAAGAEADVVGTPGAVVAGYNQVIEIYGVR